MMYKLKVVDFPIHAKLNDIPARLRWLADQFEQEANDDPLPVSLVLIERHADDKIDMRCFGDCPSDMEVFGLLHMGLDWYTRRIRRISGMDD